MAEERVQRRSAAILATDVVGYSRLIRADEEGTLARRAARCWTTCWPGDLARGHLPPPLAGRRPDHLGQPLSAAPRPAVGRRPLPPPDAPHHRRRRRPLDHGRLELGG